MTRALGLKKTRNDAAGCGVWILGFTAALFALPFMEVILHGARGDREGLRTLAFFGGHVLGFALLAVGMWVRSRAPSTSYSLVTLLVSQFYMGVFIGGFVFLAAREEPPPVAVTLVMVALAATFVWSAFRDARAAEERIRKAAQPPAPSPPPRAPTPSSPSDPPETPKKTGP